MKISTLYYFVASVPSEKIPASFLEDVSLLTFPEVTKYLNKEEVSAPDFLVQKIIEKVKA